MKLQSRISDLKYLSLEGVEEKTTKESNTREGYHNKKRERKKIIKIKKMLKTSE